MPYTHKKVGDEYVVYKKGKKVGATKGTKEALNKYLAALHIADKKTKKESKMVKEGLEEAQPTAVADNLTFWVVVKPESPSSNPQDLVFEANPFFFATQVGAGLREDDVHGFYQDQTEALNVAEELVKADFQAAKTLEEKKDNVLEKLNKRINRLQREINEHMKAAGENPREADQHHAMAEGKMSKIKELRDKCRMIEVSKRPVERIEEGFFDRVTAKAKGFGAQAKTTVGNLGAFLRGDKEAIKDPQLAKSIAILKQKASTFEGDVEEIKKDILKLFPEDARKKLPKEFVEELRVYLKTLNSIIGYNKAFATGKIAMTKPAPKQKAAKPAQAAQQNVT